MPDAPAPREPAPPPGRLPGRLRPEDMYPAGPHGNPRIGVRYLRLAAGHRVRVLECGSGQPIVLLHGWGASAYTYRHAILPLAAAGFRVIVPDVIGHGLSDKPEDRALYSLPALAESVRETMERAGAASAAVVGHSMGGGIALQLALAHPGHVTHLGLLGSARLGRVRAIAFLRALALGAAMPVYPYLLRRFGVGLLLSWVYGRGGEFSARDVDEYWAPSQYPSYARAVLTIAAEYDWSLVDPNDVRGLRVPTLIMTATGDWVVSAREAGRYAGAIEGAVLETVPGAGHLFPEAQWERTNAALLALLRRPSAPSAGRAR